MTPELKAKILSHFDKAAREAMGYSEEFDAFLSVRDAQKRIAREVVSLIDNGSLGSFTDDEIAVRNRCRYFSFLSFCD